MKKTIKSLIFLLLFFALLTYLVGTQLTKANHTTIGSIPSDIKHAREVSFPSKSGATLLGWLFEAKQGKGGVLLLHGVRSNRLQMLSRAKFFAKGRV